MDMQLLSYFSYYSMSWCNSLHHIMPMFPCVMILVSLLTRYPQFPQGYPQDNTICCASIMQKIWNVAIFSITNGNKKWKYFPTTPKSSFFKKFFHSPPTSVLSNSPQSHRRVFVVFCQAPQGEHCVFLWGLPCVVDSHKHICVCVHASETPFTKGVFLCGVHRTWCACGGSL